jgi:hypothetical protein
VDARGAPSSRGAVRAYSRAQAPAQPNRLRIEPDRRVAGFAG